MNSFLASMGGFILVLELLGVGSILALKNSALNIDIVASLITMPVIIALIAYVTCSKTLSTLNNLVKQLNNSRVAVGWEVAYTPNARVSKVSVSSSRELSIKLLLLVLGTVGLGYPAALLILANLADRYFELAGCRNVIDKRTRALQPATLGLAGALLLIRIRSGIDKCLGRENG